MVHKYNVQLGEFSQVDGSVPNSKDVDVPAVILRASSNYKQFAVATHDDKLYVGDIVKTAPNEFLTFEFYTGGMIRLNKGSACKIVSENRIEQITLADRSVWDSLSSGLTKIIFGSGKNSDPLQIRTSSGVMGIRG